MVEGVFDEGSAPGNFLEVGDVFYIGEGVGAHDC